jgi:hypothetical protein
VRPVNISDIHFHDTQILRVTEETSTDTLTMEVDYPTDWEHNVFEHRKLIFSDAYNYQVHEIPTQGIPTILGVDILDTTDRWTRLRLQTNAGFREVSCVSVTLTTNNHDA